PAFASVSDLAELEAALADTGITTITFDADITTDHKVLVDRPVTINGADFALTMTGDVAGWGGNYVLHVYDTTGVSISDITLTGGDAALLVNGSAVTLTGTIDVSGNEFGGIESSLGSGLSTDPVLVATGSTLVN